MSGPAHAVRPGEAARTPTPQHGGPKVASRPELGSELARVALQRGFTDPALPADPAVVAAVGRRLGPGMGTVLSSARVHTGPRVRSAARAVGVAAFTYGTDVGIAVDPGQPIPAGLLAHELVHVAQQSLPGQASAEQAEAEAINGDAQVTGVGRKYPAFAALDWLSTTPDLSKYGMTELIDELAEAKEWTNRQTAGSQETDRMFEAQAALEAEIARRRKAIRAADKPARPVRRNAGKRGAPAPEPAPDPAQIPRILREQTSQPLTDPDEIRAEVDRITAWLARRDVSKGDRAILYQELAALEPGLGAELNRASQQRQQARLARAFSTSGVGDRASLLAGVRMIESIQPYSAQPGMAFVMHEGEMLVFSQELANRVRAEATAALMTASAAARNMNDGTTYRMSEHMKLNYEDQPVVGFVVSVVSGEEAVDVQNAMYEPLRESNQALTRFAKAAERGSLVTMADEVFTAVEKADAAQTIVLNGIDKAISAAGSIVKGLTITRNLSFAIALSIGAILAAPVVAAGVAGTGATGLLATGMTAVGTGTVVGGGGFVLGFTGGAGGELLAGHGGSAAVRVGLGEGTRVGKQGLAIGVGGGASVGLARNLGIGALELSRGAQITRSALAGGGGNAIGSMTGAALSDLPEGESRAWAILSSGGIGLGLGAFGGAVGTGSQWLSSPVTRFGVGVGLPATSGAGVTYLQTGDWSQAIQAGGLGLTVGGLALRAPTGVTAGQERAFQFGRGIMSTARAYTGAAMIGLANTGPALRLDQSRLPAITMTSGGRSSVLSGSAQEATVAPAPAPVAQQPAPPQVAPQTATAPNIRVSAGAYAVNPARLMIDPFSGEVLGARSASARTARSMITGIRADEAEAAAWRQALGRGEIGLAGPTGANVPGGDFYTARLDPDGQFTLIATDVKMSTIGQFPTPATTIKPTWMAELQSAIAPGRLNLGDPALEAAIRAAFTAGRVQIRQLNADYSPDGGGTITGF